MAEVKVVKGQVFGILFEMEIKIKFKNMRGKLLFLKSCVCEF